MKVKELAYKSIIVCATVALFGCANVPSQVSADDRKLAALGRAHSLKAETASYQLPKMPEPGKAIVYVVRRDTGVGYLIRFNIFLDDKTPVSEMGYTRPGQYIYFNVSPGEHKIYSDAENWSETIIRAEPNSAVFLEQTSQPGVLIARNFLAEIPDYEGKSHLKSMSLGTIIKTEK